MAAVAECDLGPKQLANTDGDLLCLAPHLGRVFLDWHDDRTVLIDSAGLRRQKVGGAGPWEIVYDVDGFGMLVSDDDQDEIMLLENSLGRSIFSSPNGERFLAKLQPAPGEPAMESLTQKMRDYQKGTVVLQAPAGQVSFELFYLTWPRGACHMMWNIGDLYGHLNMKPHKGGRSKWVYGSWAWWSEIVAEHSPCTHLLKGSASVAAENVLTSEDVFLPNSGASTLTVVLLLARWCRAAPRRGGLREPDPRRQAEFILRALILGSQSVESTLELAVLPEFSYRWPRPAMTGPLPAQLKISKTGLVVMWELWALCEGRAGPDNRFQDLQWIWWDFFGRRVCAAGTIKLDELLLDIGILFDGTCQAFWLQLVWHVAMRLEILDLQTRGKEVHSFDFKPSPVELADSWDVREVDKSVMTFVAASKVATHGFSNAGVAIDKASGRGLSVQNGLMVLPNNVAFAFVPQARFMIPQAGGLFSRRPGRFVFSPS